MLFGIYGIISTFQLKEINLFKHGKLESEKQSVFDEYLDEIIYFFEETDYRVVFFEDLDRLNCISIFTHLRELNIILNNDNNLKQRPIKFVYAVRDDIFKDSDRTKFFDFIIPVIPYINPTNSKDELLNKIKPYVEFEELRTVEGKKFINDISPFIKDNRILDNICNEFVLYSQCWRYE